MLPFIEVAIKNLVCKLDIFVYSSVHYVFVSCECDKWSLYVILVSYLRINILRRFPV